MYPKTFSFLSLSVCVMLMNFSLHGSENATPAPFFNEAPSLTFDFNNCSAFGGIASANYGEFTPTVIDNPNCSKISMVGPSLYRINPLTNGHSCAPSNDGTSAMCISGSASCDYLPGDQKAIRVNVLVEPGPDGLGSIDNISFLSKSPQMFQFITGETGLNDYPTLVTIVETSSMFFI